jgi:CheY-like chemotaxis protein/anti-sigma regulatory factor (Ser/Thr protein kinase)
MSPATILLVDSQPPLVAPLLEGELFDLIVVATGNEALALLEREPKRFKIVVAFRQCRDVDGLKLLKHIKRNKLFYRIPVILFDQGINNIEDITACFRAGAFHYMEKPFSKLSLIQMIQTALSDYLQIASILEEVSHQLKGLRLLDRARFYCHTLEEAAEIVKIIASACPDASRIVLGLTELLNNAIEHGNLGITYTEKGSLIGSGIWIEELGRRLNLPENRNKRVCVDFNKMENEIVVVIKDEGEGFDWKNFLDFDPKRLTDNNGRGIASARLRSFDRLQYHGKGNIVEAGIFLKKQVDGNKNHD